MTELSSRTVTLLADARVQLLPSAAQVARLRVAVVGFAPAAATATPSAAAPAAIASSSAKLAIVVAALLGAGVGTFVGLRAFDSSDVATAPTPAPRAVPAVVEVPAPSPTPTVTPLPAPVVPPVVAPAKPRARPAAAHPPAAAPPSEIEAPSPPPDDSLAREVALLRRARASLRSGDASAAWLALEDHARDFADGQLVEEADALTVETLCALGRDDAAARVREDFLSRWPRSAQRARIQHPCHAEDSDAP